jgi:hypothetical protein
LNISIEKNKSYVKTLFITCQIWWVLSCGKH